MFLQMESMRSIALSTSIWDKCGWNDVLPRRGGLPVGN